MTIDRPVTLRDLDQLFERMKEVFVTKDDLKYELKSELKVVTDSIEGTISEAADEVLNAINDRFDIVENRLDRIEDKLDRTAAVVDLHTVDIRQLKRRLAI